MPVGPGDPRADGVDPDVLRRIIDGQAPHEVDRRRLGRAVRRVLLLPDDADLGRQDHDRATAGLAEVRNGRSRAGVRTERVDGELALPLLRFGLLNGAEAVDADAADDRLEPSQGIGRLVDRPLDVGRVGDVAQRC